MVDVGVVVMQMRHWLMPVRVSMWLSWRVKPAVFVLIIFVVDFPHTEQLSLGCFPFKQFAAISRETSWKTLTG